MKVKKHCNCPTETLTEENYKGLLFEAIQKANQNGKDRAIVMTVGTITHIDYNAAIEFEYKVYAIIKVGTKSIRDVNHVERPI